MKFILKNARSRIKDTIQDGLLILSRTFRHLDEITDGQNSVMPHLKPIIKQFGGCMNPLCHIVEHHDTSDTVILFDNIFKIIDAHGDTALQEWRNKFFVNFESWVEPDIYAKSEILVNLFKQCGITCVKESSVKWSEELIDRYNKLSALEDGQPCKVVAPYWLYENDVFEKGIIMKL